MLKTISKAGVTIAMPFFNSAVSLELSIRSLLNQSCSDFELLLCDDGFLRSRSGHRTELQRPAYDLLERWTAARPCRPIE
jgi:hypothetical protein